MKRLKVILIALLVLLLVASGIGVRYFEKAHQKENMTLNVEPFGDYFYRHEGNSLYESNLLGKPYSDFMANDKLELLEKYQQGIGEQWLYKYMSRQLHFWDILFMRIDHLDTLKFKFSDTKIVYRANSDINNFTLQTTITYENKGMRLFKTKGVHENDYEIVNLQISFFIDGDNKLHYINDTTPEQAYLDAEQEQGGKRGDDKLDGLYDMNNNTLRVRGVEGQPWIETPVLTEEFSVQAKGWYVGDQRLLVQDEKIAILHGNQGLFITLSYDSGKTWVTKEILSSKYELGGLGFAKISIEGNNIIIVADHHVAMNSYIASYHQSLDGGNTWNNTEIKNESVRFYGISILNQKDIFYTENDDPILYHTSDLGETINRIELPKTDTIEGPYKESSLEWEEVYRQAHPPYIEDGRYYVVLAQGEMRDYKDQSAILYYSEDQGKTWQFKEHYVWPEQKVVEPN